MPTTVRKKATRKKATRKKVAVKKTSTKHDTGVKKVKATRTYKKTETVSCFVAKTRAICGEKVTAVMVPDTGGGVILHVARPNEYSSSTYPAVLTALENTGYEFLSATERKKLIKFLQDMDD